jgi:hypothetical protein
MAGTMVLAFGLALVAPVPAVAAVAAPPAFCHGSAALAATDLPSPISLRSCPIEGRTVVMALPDGRTVGGAPVPGARGEVINSVLTTGGEYELRVATDAHGVVTVHQSIATGAAVPARSPATPALAATDAACGEGTYVTDGHWDYTPTSWASIGWSYNESTVSRAGLSGPATLADIRAGNYNMTTGQNNCGFATGAFAARGAYFGTTSLYANVDSGGHCTTRFPDGYDTVSWGPLPSSGVDHGLAVTCVHRLDGYITEADIYLGSNANLIDDVTTGTCANQYDLQSVATHEWGHAYGLGDETGGTAEVMYPKKSPCLQRRHLGLGDWNGMRSLYD